MTEEKNYGEYPMYTDNDKQNPLTREELREKLAQICCDNCIPLKHCGADDDYCQYQGSMCDQILVLIEQAGYVQLDPDQNRPKNPHSIYGTGLEQLAHDDYADGQQDMLKAGWRKIVENQDRSSR